MGGTVLSMTLSLRRIAALATSTVLLLGCTTPQDIPTQRLPLADRSQLLAKVPRGWTLQPTWAPGQRLTLLRISTRGPDIAQLRLEPRLDPSLAVRPDQAALRASARRELTASRGCEDGAAVQERQLKGGLAVFCTRPLAGRVASGLLPGTAGVYATRELTVRFAFLELDAEELNAAWALLQSIEVDTLPLTY